MNHGDEREPTAEELAFADAFLTAASDEVDAAMLEVYGQFPEWVPAPAIYLGQRIIQWLLNDDIPVPQIVAWVAAAMRDEAGMIWNGRSRTSEVYELAHLRWAVQAGVDAGLRDLAGEDAVLGRRFSSGRKKGTEGPISKAIGAALKLNPALTNAALWAQIAANPPRGWDFRENRQGRYIEGPHGGQGMDYARFRNIAAQKRTAAREG